MNWLCSKGIWLADLSRERSNLFASYLKKKRRSLSIFENSSRVYLVKVRGYERRESKSFFFSFVRSLSVSGPIDTNAFSKVCVFVVIKNPSINSRPHYRCDTFSNKTFENDRIPCACHKGIYKHTHLRYFGYRFHFDAFFDRFRPSTLIWYIRCFVLIPFQECFQIDAFSLKTYNE